MFLIPRKAYFLALLGLFTLHMGQAQFGPGGVGDAGEVVLWLHHEGLNDLNAGNPVWDDISGYDNHATTTAAQLPIVMNGRFGNKPGARFNGGRTMTVADAPELNFGNELSFAAVIGNQGTATVTRFIFSKGAGATNELGYAFDARNDQISARISDGTNEYYDGVTFAGLNNAAFSITSYDRSSQNQTLTSETTSPQVFPHLNNLGGLSNATDLVLAGGPFRANSSNWIGYIGEVIILNRDLNQAENIILENYLGTTFGISHGRSLYNHGANYNYELAGIGRVNGANEQSDAKGTAMIRIDQASDLENGEYLLWAHDNQRVVSGGTDDNVWRVDHTGDVGQVRVRVYAAGFNVVDESNLSFFVSNNSGFNFPTEHKPSQWDAVNEIATFEDVTFENNDYFKFTKEVVVSAPPTLEQCPLNISRVNDPGLCGASVGWVPPISDGTLTSTHDPGDVFPVGTTTVTYTATNPDGMVTCSFNIVVSDNEAPQLSACPSNLLLPAVAGCNQTVSWVEPTATDNCSATVTSSHNPGDNFAVGITTVTYTATDVAGNSVNCSFEVTIEDNEIPVISNCPGNVLLSVDDACDPTVNWTPPTATDNCNVTLTSSHNPGSSFSFGTTTVTYTATDDSGNRVDCSFEVTVVDEILPQLAGCPTDINLEATANCQTTVTWTPPTATDNCNVILTSSHNPNDLFPLGNTTVSYTASDDAGNSVSCSFEIRVTDSTLPDISNCMPAVIISDFQPGTQDAVATWLPPTATDNCQIASFEASHQPGDRFPVGSTKVTYTAEDSNGNSNSCNFEVQVTAINTGPVYEPLILTVNAGETVAVCLEATDQEGDLVVLKEVTPLGIQGVLTNIDGNAQCFNYTAPDSFEGTEIIEVTLCDDGDPTVCLQSTVEIKVEMIWQLDISQVVTPNGDGINDTWYIGNIDKYPVNKVLVFDRWGGAIYRADNYNNNSICWRGNSEGDRRNSGGAPSGTYFYQIELGDGQNFKGFIELVDK